MSAQLRLFLTELRLLIRYRILLAAGLAMAGYVAVFAIAGRYFTPEVTAFLIYTDPAVLGLAFAGLLTMLERDEGVAAALAVSPVGAFARLFWRFAALSIPALAASTVFAVLFAGVAHWPAFLLTTFATSVTYCAIGVILAQRVRRVTAFIAVSGLVVLPVSGSALFAFSDWPIAVYWPFASQLAALVATLSQTQSVSVTHLGLSAAAAVVMLLAASRALSAGGAS